MEAAGKRQVLRKPSRVFHLLDALAQPGHELGALLCPSLVAYIGHWSEAFLWLGGLAAVGKLVLQEILWRRNSSV